MSHAIEYSELDRFHADYYLRNRPVIIRGLREHNNKAPIFEWSTSYFERLMGDKKVSVMATQTGFLSYERNFVEMTFGEFVARMFEPDAESGTRYYYKNPTSVLLAGQNEDIHVPELRPYTSRAVAKNLWISSSGLTVGLHFDPADNLNFQLRGHKSFVLYPPGVRAYYPLPMFSQTAHISGVYRDGPNPDLRRFSRFDPSAGIRFDLQEGEVLYIPAYWWHQVESLGRENLNLNFWWLPKLSKQLTNWNQALRGHIQVSLRYLKYGNIQQAPKDKQA
jgi:hypothetical protein